MQAVPTTSPFGAPGSTGVTHAYPRWRWLAIAWLAVYVPAYTEAYGVLNFLFLCNLGVIITAVALIAGNQLWLSSQAVAAPMIGLAWALDAGWRLATGDFLFGATAYMWDGQYPLFTRLLSLYHLGWPLLLVYCLKRHGYDRRGWPLQSAIAATALVVARLGTDPAENVNFAFVDPLFGLALEPAPLHLAMILGGLTLVAYGLTHLAWSRLFSRAPR
jgi:hypothetical protein